MVFSSLSFIFLFLPVVVIIYFLTPRRRVKNVVLLLASLLFYAWGEPIYIILILISILCCFILARRIEAEKHNDDQAGAKACLVLAVVIALGILGFFKYYGFLVENINQLLAANLAVRELPLPIGISFYTFQMLSYVIDVYREDVKAQKNILNLALYVAMFPQLIAGPIVRYNTIENQLENRQESLPDFVAGLRRFVIGLGKKVIIANQMGIIADAVFTAPSGDMGTQLVWLAAIAYTFQIYFDFSGYSDMAIGIGRMFGFRYLENFNYPYVSQSITEFWRRWHISLGTWFRDYLYIPLGGNRRWPLRNIFIVWFLTGLWHGASWNFILWGLYYGVLLALEKYTIRAYEIRIPRAIRHIYTLFFVVVGWVLFRVENLSDLLFYLQRMFSYHPTTLDTVLYGYQDLLHALPFLAVALIASLPFFTDAARRVERGSGHAVLKSAHSSYIIAVFIIALIFLLGETFNPFIYFRF
ncbi:MAG: MBOAT family protein [Syntrophomonadaceae bacterium]|nr:MBOAT family protein [Syntrophomonadaceae bacterium]